MPLRYRIRILDHLAHGNYRPSSHETIARHMQVPEDELDIFSTAIDGLVADEKIIVGTDEMLHLPKFPDEITGRFRLNQRGFGFVIPDEPFREGDLFIPKGENRDAVSGDTVRAAVMRQQWRAKARPGRSEAVGRIIEVLERGRDAFVGTLVKHGNEWYVEPDSRSLYDPVLIRDPHAKNAKVGDKVVIELLHYPDPEYVAEGVITRVLGEAGRPDVETEAVIEAHGLRTEFPDEAVEQARAAAQRFEEDERRGWPGREDLTERFIFTIDPPDARDFDDAISIEHDENAGEWTLGVHIADVAHFIDRGSPLDSEAQARGTSVYLPRLVIPMLPEVLSNGVCSLQEGVPRFTKSVFITFDGKGRVLGQRVSATVIRSCKRLTYLEAQALIDGQTKEARKHAKAEPAYTDELLDALRRSNTLARILRARRRRDGMITLNLPDVELVFDEEGHVTDAVPEDDAYTHTIIEMFMVEANEAVARVFDDLAVPVLRRIHPDPSVGDLQELRMYAAVAHQKLPEEPTRHDLQRILEATAESPAARAIHFAVLRTLTKASYSPALIGHYALASNHYAHFTSPIRRYPDLTVHRALMAYLDATDNGRSVPGGKKRRALGRRLADDTRVPDEGDLIELGRHCSDREVEAATAERELREFLVLQFLHEHHLGDEFPGVVTGVTGGGVFISLEKFLVDGFVKIEDVGRAVGRGGRWELNQSIGRLTQHGGRGSLGIGDVVTVQIVSVEPASRQMELLITKLPERAAHVAEPKVKKHERGRGREKIKSGGRGKGKGKGKGRGRRR
jgi:ribonuclease R